MKKVYCIHCGKKNSSKNKYCDFCHKKVNERDRVLFDYLFDQSVSDVKDTVISNIFDKIKYFLKKYLYGIILSITVVTSIVSNIVIRSNDSFIVDSKPIFNRQEIIKYNSVDSFMEAFINYYMVKDKEKLEMMLFDNVYPEDSISLEIDTSQMAYVYDSSLIKDISIIEEIDVFSQDNMKIFFNIKDMKDVSLDELKYYGDLVVKLVQKEIDTYVAEISFVYYDNTNEEEFYFDLDIILIEVDGSYYIAGINYFDSDNRIEEFLDVHNESSEEEL